MVKASSLGVFEQLRRSLAICEKDIRIYYFKGPVVIFGILLPFFLYLAFYIGRNIPASLLVPGMVAMTLFFTSTSVVPVIAPWETRMKTLERLASAPIYVPTIIIGDVFASFFFGVIISIFPLLIGLLIGVNMAHPFTLAIGIVTSSFCFSSLGALLSSPHTDNPSNIMMLSTLIKFPLIFISGIFLPIEAMPGWSRVATYISPLTYFTDLARHSLLGQSYFPTYVNLIMLTVFTVVFLLLSIKLHESSLPKRL